MVSGRHLTRIIALFWLIAKLISYKLWMGDRLYPLVPVFEAANSIPVGVHAGLLAISLSLLSILLIFPASRVFMASLIIAEVLSCSLDVTRWQPWEYFYLFLLTVLLLRGRCRERLYFSVLLIICSTYIFSGLGKLNGGFLHEVWKTIILRKFAGIPPEYLRNEIVHYAGLLLPMTEIVLGLALFFLKKKKWPAGVLMAMHVFILLLLSPVGINYNPVVWPWNIAMICLLYYSSVNANLQQILIPKISFRRDYLLLIFWVLLPALSFGGYWGKYLSSGLYSGNHPALYICFKEGSVPDDIANADAFKGDSKLCNLGIKLSVHQWAITELGVPPYPEYFYYRWFKKAYENRYGSSNAIFIVMAYPYQDNETLP